MRDPSRQEEGFTLIEVLIAITILAIGLLAISQMQITSLQSNSGSNRVAILNQLGCSVVEEIFSWQTNDPRLLVAGTVAYDFNPDPGVAEPTISFAGGGSYTASYVVQPGVPIATVTTVTVTVRSNVVGGFFGRAKTFVALKRTQ